MAAARVYRCEVARALRMAAAFLSRRHDLNLITTPGVLFFSKQPRIVPDETLNPIGDEGIPARFKVSPSH
jgi:hypothetical protein